MHFAENLKKARTRLGLTQEELAKKIGIAQNAISAYERGLRTPRVLKIPKIAEVLGLSVDELIE